MNCRLEFPECFFHLICTFKSGDTVLIWKIHKVVVADVVICEAEAEEDEEIGVIRAIIQVSNYGLIFFYIYI